MGVEVSVDDYSQTEAEGWVKLLELGLPGVYPCLELWEHPMGHTGLWLLPDGVSWSCTPVMPTKSAAMLWAASMAPVVSAALESHRLMMEVERG